MCVRTVDDEFFHHAVYDPPEYFLQDNRRFRPTRGTTSNKWLTLNHHHFSVYDGFRKYILAATDLQRVLSINPSVIFVMGRPKIEVLQTLLCGRERIWSDVHQLYTMEIGIPIVDILTLYDTNGCGEDYAQLAVENMEILRGRLFVNNNFKRFKKNCPYHFSKHCALDNAYLLLRHFYDIYPELGSEIRV